MLPNRFDLRVRDIKPLGCISCGSWDTKIMVFRYLSVVQCNKCQDAYSLKSAIFNEIQKRYIQEKFKDPKILLNLCKN
jgi:hypothetical protein